MDVLVSEPAFFGGNVLDEGSVSGITLIMSIDKLVVWKGDLSIDIKSQPENYNWTLPQKESATMHVGIITYQTGHLKTWQLLTKLRMKSFKVSLFAFPFKHRPSKHTPHFQDRPHQLINLDIKRFCHENGIQWVEMEGWRAHHTAGLGDPLDQNSPDVFLTCIAKIIPKCFLNNRIILNAHPGILPQNRGLDAFKWAVIRPQTLGITLHVIDEYIDRGTIIHRVKVPVFQEDTLKDVAHRGYEMECDLQANFEHHLCRVKDGLTVGDKFPLSRMRIPMEMDQRIEEIFERNKKKLIELSKGEL